jgi:putative NADPH-quinone reductase
MKSVTAFVGSARQHGVTQRATRQLLANLEAPGDVRGELVFLSEHHVGLCRGCKACFIRGEAHCPLHDDRDLLIEKLTRSDGVVFASPVYSFQVSALMKAFLDRLGFAFNVVKGSRIVCRKNPDTAHEPMLEAERRRMDEALARQGRRFRQQLASPPFPEPSLLALFAFRTARTSIELEIAEDRPDHAYYRERGWFESDYYYPTRLGPVKRAAGAAFDRLAARSSRPRQLHPAER